MAVIAHSGARALRYHAYKNRSGIRLIKDGTTLHLTRDEALAITKHIVEDFIVNGDEPEILKAEG